MRLAFILDPLDGLKPYKDSSVAIMRAAALRGHDVYAIQREALHWRGGAVGARALRILPQAEDHLWFLPAEWVIEPLHRFDAVLMRQDPPFDFEYVAATWLLERAVAQGARVYNHPGAIRDHSEKLSILEFPQFIPETLVARDPEDIHSFIGAHGKVVLKPLDGMGGSQIFLVAADDPNRNVIVETLNGEGRRTIMAQQYLPAISEGDKRVLIVGGEVVPFALARIPKTGETRGNLAAGGRGVAMPLTAAEHEVAETLAPELWARGLFIVGLDLIGGRLTEINVTSPTCMVEIAVQSGFDVPALVVRKLETLAAES